MDRNTFVLKLKDAKRTATILIGRNTNETDNYQDALEHIDAALNAMGESTSAHIGADTVSRVTTYGKPRFGTTPPSMTTGTSMALKLEEEGKAAGVVEPEPAAAPDEEAPEEPSVEPEPVETTEEEPATDEPSDKEVSDKLTGAAGVGLITETDISSETLGLLANYTVKEIADRFKGTKVIVELIEKLGGAPKEGGSKMQQASILKSAAAAKLQ